MAFKDSDVVSAADKAAERLQTTCSNNFNMGLSLFSILCEAMKCCFLTELYNYLHFDDSGTSTRGTPYGEPKDCSAIAHVFVVDLSQIRQ